MPALDDDEVDRLREVIGHVRAEQVSLLVAAIRINDPVDAAQVMAAALEQWRAQIPAVSDLFGGIREDAAFWADMATPMEIEAFTAAGLRKIERTEFGEAARKRIFAAMWESFDDADRRAFLARVDPAGKFRGRK